MGWGSIQEWGCICTDRVLKSKSTYKIKSTKYTNTQQKVHRKKFIKTYTKTHTKVDKNNYTKTYTNTHTKVNRQKYTKTYTNIHTKLDRHKYIKTSTNTHTYNKDLTFTKINALTQK